MKSKSTTDGQLALEFRPPQELAAIKAEAEEWAQKMEAWRNTPSPPPPPALPPLPGWEQVVPGRTACKIVRSRFPEELGKIVVIRKVMDNRTVWASAGDEPAVYRKNMRGRWVCEWDPAGAQRPFSMEDLCILPEPWTPKPPVYRR